MKKSYDEIAINQTEFINHSDDNESVYSYNNEIVKYIFDIFTYHDMKVELIQKNFWAGRFLN